MKKVMKVLLALATITIINNSYAAGELQVYLKNNLSGLIDIAYRAKSSEERRAPNWRPRMDKGTIQIEPGQNKLIMEIPLKPGPLGNLTWNFIATLSIPGISQTFPLDIKVDKDEKASVSFPGERKFVALQGYVPIKKLKRPYGTNLSMGPGAFTIDLGIAPSDGETLNLDISQHPLGKVELIKK